MYVILIGQYLLNIQVIFKGALAELQDPYHAIYGTVGVIELLVIYNRLLNKYQ